MTEPAKPALLEIDGLVAGYGTRDTPPVLDGVSLAVRPGEILGLIGETGSGKTTLARAVVGLVPARSGRVTFAGTELGALGGRALRGFRRRGEVQYVFQDPLRALDPDLTAADSVAEPLAAAARIGARGDRRGRAERAQGALRAVGLDSAQGGRRPGELSGGQRQRVLLARALVTGPRLLICDEPVSALDAANRNHVLRLLLKLRAESGIAALVITHDLHSLAGVADRVAVLHQGRLVEQGPVREVLDAPQHPYTRRLLAAAPRLHARGAPAAASRTAVTHPTDLANSAAAPNTAAAASRTAVANPAVLANSAAAPDTAAVDPSAGASADAPAGASPAAASTSTAAVGPLGTPSAAGPLPSLTVQGA